MTYTLTDANELAWEAKATTDAPTVLNIVHHSYWNLSGDPDTSINDHELTLYADHYLATNPGLIPTGEKAAVADTPMDFTSPHLIGERVEADFEALKLGGGYDHAWVLNGTKEGDLVKASKLRDPETGRVMEISTNQPAIQFYGGNFSTGRRRVRAVSLISSGPHFAWRRKTIRMLPIILMRRVQCFGPARPITTRWCIAFQ